ncbi:DUF547 domain-containing protein [Psychroserpens ponticola]|uniref:DUF547 domain-containing protein n=1 Tax=Psychroserpens ponticola TaxID=2932268 RepID=A0ABY7RVT2_9FLAO|nr:DUF547 domain-containing protein [Psychroserpens ponticola]WCO01225.1 DUF547 domain-containing protein [Psychroserpens ponticola]
MKRYKLFVFAMLFGISSSFSQNTSVFFKLADDFFKSNVSNGKVAYSKIVANPELLNQLVSFAENISVSKNDTKTYQAFYINAYNISVIKGIIDNYPLKSPLDSSGFFDKITYQIAGELITLNDIENVKLRAHFNDARFHFVLVCGALGCPPLIDSAYFPNSLESQLQEQAEIALNNASFIKYSNNELQLSEIFKWYKEDFVKSGNEIDYINRFRANKIDSNAIVSYYSYNWNLNKQ